LDIVLGAQTVRRGGVGPVRSLLGGKPHRPLCFFTSLRFRFRRGWLQVIDLQQLRCFRAEMIVAGMMLKHRGG
jgi:hypothetical protein